MFEKVLVCLDGSELAEQIMPYATEQALRFNSRLTLLQVMTMPTSVYMGAEGMAAGTEYIVEEEVRRQQPDIEAYLDSIARPLQESGIALEYAILPPSPVGDAIVNYARDNAIGLICIATHGRGGLGRVVFGSVAGYVLSKSALPVLLIRSKRNTVERK